MTDYSRTWIYAAPSEIVRADRLISLNVSDGEHDNRAGETNASGVLWAYVTGRTEPVRIGGFIGITAAAILAAMADALHEVVGIERPCYLLDHGGRAGVENKRDGRRLLSRALVAVCGSSGATDRSVAVALFSEALSRLLTPRPGEDD